VALIAFFLGFAFCAVLVSQKLRITRENQRVEIRDSKVTTGPDSSYHALENFDGTKVHVDVTLADPHSSR